MQADERHHNPMGTVHGGIYCDLADAAMGFAYASTLEARRILHDGRIKNQLLSPRPRGETGSPRRHVVRAVNALGYVECDVKDADGKLVARVASTCMTLRSRDKETAT